MSTTILATKLYLPPPRAKIVLRPRLIEKLNEGLSSRCTLRMTLISAAAGFGKTTLVSEWVASCGRPVAWLSLDEGDSDLARFLTYLVAAVQAIAPKIGAGVLAILQSPQPPPTESILTILINEINTVPEDFIFVLDDYHIIDSKPVDNALAFLIEHLPPQMHLVIATREDPPLPLARLRVRCQLTELRAADLRFTPAEAAEFLNQMMGLNLSAEDIAALETRTEGWIAGLQLAALSMQGHASRDAANFIKSFTGNHHFILDYLVEEVLQRQPEPVRNFLLQTAILDRLNSPLCDAVTGQEDGRGMLEALERGNLFVIPLDDQRQWYRYHHLFAEVLQAHLREAQPDRVSILHLRASEWYERNGLRSEAIHHALAARDFEGAAGLIELAGPATEDGSIQQATWLGWVKKLPEELVHLRPVLNVWYAYILLGSGELETADSRFKDAERWLESADTTKVRQVAPSAETCPESNRRMVVVDKKQFKSLPATIAIGRAYIALALGNIPDTVRYASRVLELTEADPFRHSQASMMLGMNHWASGSLEAAERVFAEYTMKLRTAGNIPDAIGTSVVLADIRLALGHLHEAINTLEQLLQFVMDQGEPIPLDAADLHRELSKLHLEQGNLEAAAKHLQRSKELGEKAQLPVSRYRLCIDQARLKTAQGDLEGALALLDEAEHLYIRSPLPDFCPISAMKARIWVAQGKLTKALEWVREQTLSVDDAPSYLREFEYVTLARVLIARYQSDRGTGSIREAVGLLERLLQAAEEGKRMGSMIEILVLQALAHQAQGNITTALVSLERALTLAEPEGYVRIFLDEGKPMVELLKRAGKNKSSFLEKQAIIPQPLIEPLSENELEVLRLLRTELSGPEIARERMVSLNTIRTHTQHIYAKLGVNNRRVAVRRAEELNLL
ncbi:MAG: tetratricopeptide repeat protein [Chloroflexi bacterium]|nr:tetratricopeptide repeat protein [Chloroflexota bacterium]